MLRNDEELLISTLTGCRYGLVSDSLRTNPHSHAALSLLDSLGNKLNDWSAIIATSFNEPLSSDQVNQWMKSNSIDVGRFVNMLEIEARHVPV